jgi:ParB/RepB/Spo0J family partition protein
MARRRGSAPGPAAAAPTKPSSENARSPVLIDALNGATITDVPKGDINHDDRSTQFRITTRVDDLRASIERQGQSHPVDLFGTKPYRIIDGFRRVQAIKELGWPVAKAIVHGGITKDDALRLAFTSNAARKNLSPLDKANAIRVCKQCGMKAPEVATMLGISERQLERYAWLLTFSKSLQELVDANEVSMAHAVVIAKFDGISLVDWVERLQEQKWSASELRRELRKAASKRATKSRPCAQIRRDECRVYARRFSAATPANERERAIAEYERLIAVQKRERHGENGRVQRAAARSDAGSSRMIGRVKQAAESR